MRRLLILLAVLAAGGCARQRLRPSDQRDPPDAGLASIIHTGNPRTSRQLLAGFHGGDETGRWTRRSFSVRLRVPPLQDPALLLRMFLPESHIERLGPVTVSSSVNGVSLEPETFAKAGMLSHVRRIPPAALGTNPARVDFSVDKWMPAGTVESRELGVVAIVVGLKNGLSPEIW